MASLTYVLETHPDNIELVRKIKNKSSSDDIKEAVDMATQEQQFRSSKVAYAVYWSFEAINIGVSATKPISLITDSQLETLMKTLKS